MYKKTVKNCVSVIIAALFFVSSSTATAFHGGTAVSTGSNPAFAVGGGISSASTVSIKTAPTTGVLIVSDVVLTVNPHGNCVNTISLQTSSGSIIGQFQLGSQRAANTSTGGSYTTAPDQIQHSFAFGLPVPSGEDLELVTSSSCEISYTIAGYISAP